MNDWIETSFAWPYPQMWVLALNRTGQMVVAFMDYIDGQLEWMVEDCEKENITHWKRLPEPPIKTEIKE